MNWQTIETAPKDTAILAYASGWKIAHYNTAHSMWVGYGFDTSDTERLNRFDGPTHWMPLPDAPVT